MKKSGVILFDPGKMQVLLVRGKKYQNSIGFIFPSGIYSFPKGHMQEGESISGCALRELWEETNIKISINRTDPMLELNGGHYFIKFVDADEIKYRIRNRGEISKIMWKSIYDLSHTLCNKAVREFAQKYPKYIISY